jgi:hypothetical protein
MKNFINGFKAGLSIINMEAFGIICAAATLALSGICFFTGLVFGVVWLASFFG